MDTNAVSQATRHIVAYILHDAAANVEGYITDYSPESLKGAEEMGLVILAEYNDGTREVVKAADVKQPDPTLNGVTVVLPPYVDVRMQAVVDVFDALQSIMFPDAMALAADGAEPQAATRDPVEVFREKMAALREFTKSGEGE